MTVDALERSRTLAYHLVDLISPEGDSAYYTDWTEDVTGIAGENYVSTPSLEIQLPTNDGLLNKQDGRIALPYVMDADHITDRLTSGEPHADVQMKITEVYRDPEGSAPTIQNVVFDGVVVRARRNYDDQIDIVLLQALPEKGRIATASVGIQILHLCGNSLGDAACGVDLTPHTHSVVVTAIDAGRLTVTGVPGSTPSDIHFQRGYVESQGLRIMVQKWNDTTPSYLYMMVQPPARWLGRTVSLVAGCRKDYAGSCVAVFNNGNQFKGPGHRMPPYDPQFEGSPDKGFQ